MAEETQKQIESYVKENMQEELSSEMKRVNRLADLVMDLSHNQGGEELANV